MSTYYLVLNEKDAPIPIGEQSFKKFYPDVGFDFLQYLVKRDASRGTNLIKFIKINKDDGKTLSIDEFLSLFEGSEGLKICRNY